MKNFRKISSVVILSFFVLTLFSGCRTKAPQAKKQTYEGVELVYYKMFDDSEVIDPIIKQYEASHPGLKIKYKKFTDFEEYQRVILNEMAEGEGPDIFSMPNTWIAGNIKKLAPMPGNAGSISAFEELFVDVAAKDLIHVGPDGQKHIYAIPMTVDTLALYYNKDHFEDRIPSRGKPSSTWEGIKQDISLLNKEDNSLSRFEVAGIPLGRADNISRGVDILYLLFLQHGVNFYNENISEATFAGIQGGFNQYPAQTALELYKSFADPNQRHYTWNEFMADSKSDTKELDTFARGKVSMMVGFSYHYDELINHINVLKNQGIETINPSAIRIASIPQLADPSVSTSKRVTYASYFTEAVSRNTKHAKVAWDFLIELSKQENLDYYFEKTHNPTSRRDMIDSQARDPIYGVFASQIGFAESFPIIDYYEYKRIFTDLITSANESFGTVNLVRVQDEISKLLPDSGVKFQEIVLKEEDAK